MGGRRRSTRYRVTSRESHRTSARKIARETDFYRIESEDIDADKIPPLLFETLLGEIEGHAVEAIDVLLEHGFDGFERDPSLGGWLTLFMAFQLTRGNRYRQEHLAVVNAGMLEIYGHVADEGIAARIEESGEEPTPEKVVEHRAFIEGWKRGEYFVAPQDAELIGTGASMAGEIAPMIGQRQWALYRAPVDLITCDEPVVAVGGPEISRRTLGGIGTAGVLLFPLEPRTLLAMFHPWVELSDVGELLALTYDETGEINLEIATSGHRWLIERPHTTQTRVIPLPIPRTAFALEELPTSDPLRTLIHTYRPIGGPCRRHRRRGRSPAGGQAAQQRQRPRTSSTRRTAGVRSGVNAPPTPTSPRRAASAAGWWRGIMVS